MQNSLVDHWQSMHLLVMALHIRDLHYPTSCLHTIPKLCLLVISPTMCLGLKLPLHTYQRHALAWMSWRERIGGKSAEDATFAVSSSQQDSADAEAADMFGVGEGAVHPCWQPITLPSGLHVYENRYTGNLHSLLLQPSLLA